MEEPKVRVGIMAAEEVRFVLLTPYICGQKTLSGTQTARIEGGQILCGEFRGTELHFEAISEEARFSVEDVVIGVRFHWQRLQKQTFQGALTLCLIEGKIQIINEIGAEDYLRSVIGSEMNATASLELLKAHAVISRSWLLCRIMRDNPLEPFPVQKEDGAESEDRVVRWYGRDEHRFYDVCADDHCQRYQGLGHIHSETVDIAVEATRGEVLTYGGTVCDARFSKCCGGVSETYDTAWEDRRVPYLQAIRDDRPEASLPDLTQEAEARAWINATPNSFCNTSDKGLLRQVLND